MASFANRDNVVRRVSEYFALVTIGVSARFLLPKKDVSFSFVFH